MFLKIFWSSICVYVLTHVWFFATPCTVAPQAPLPTGFPRQGNWSGFPFPPPGDFSNPGIKPKSLALAVGFFTTEPPGKLLSQFSRVRLCDHMDCSTPGFPVHHQLQEPTQTHVHCISDTIQPSHPLPFPSPLAFNLSQHQGLFQWVGSSGSIRRRERQTTSIFLLENSVNNMKREATTCFEMLRWKIVSREVWHNKFK